MAVADYESAEIKVYEGQFLEVLDQSNPTMWLVKTKPTKVRPSIIMCVCTSGVHTEGPYNKYSVKNSLMVKS